MGAAMAHRGDLFSERFGVRSQLRCGVLVPQGRVSSVPLPCSAFPDLAFPVLAAQNSDGHDPKLVEALLLRSLRGREAELEALNLLVKEDVGQLVSVAAPVAALVTSSHAPVSVSAAGPSCSSQSSGVSRFVGEEVVWSQVAKLCHLCDGRWASLGTGHAMLLKHIAYGQVRFLMQDMSSQVLCTFVVYTCQSLCSAYGCSVTTVGAVSTFLVERCGRCASWQTAGGPGRYTNTGHGTGGVASAGPPGVWRGSGLLGHCWHLASPRRFVFSFVYGSASGYSFAFGAVRGFLFVGGTVRGFSFAYGSSRGYSFALVLGRGFSFAGGSVRGFNLAFVPVRGLRGFCVLLDGVF